VKAAKYKVGDQVTWIDRKGLRCTGRISEVETEKFSEVTYFITVDGEDDMGTILIEHEFQLESAVDRLGRLT
jgi:hypothetical protein